MGSKGSMGALTRKKEGKYMKLRFWQRTAEKKDFDIAVWGGQYDQLYVEIRVVGQWTQKP